MRSLGGDWERGDKIRGVDVLDILVALVALVVLDIFLGVLTFAKKCCIFAD